MRGRAKRLIPLEAHDVCTCIYRHVARALNYARRLGLARHPEAANREHAARDRALSAGPDPRPCAMCGELTPRGNLCGDCVERARPYQPDDPYADHGGESEPESTALMLTAAPTPLLA